MESHDEVHDSLNILLRDLYDFIVRESNSGAIQMMPLLHQQISQHEIFNPLMTAIATDSSLVKFFPGLRGKPSDVLDVDSIKRAQSIIIWADGSAGGMTPLTLCNAILGDAFRYLWSWKDDPSLNDALMRLPDSIDLARNLAEKRAVRIPAVVSIHNIGLTGGRTVQVGSAILREPIRYDRFRLAAITQDETALVLRFETDFSAVHIRATSTDADRDEEQAATHRLMRNIGYKAMERQTRRLNDEVNRARLAIVLASSSDKIFAPVQGWDSAPNPLSDINHSRISNARSLSAPYPAQKIGKSAERRIARYASLIGQYPDALRAGNRRLLLAVTERMYPEDGFVDAIICWEALFSGTPETTLRVCGSMAKLLGPADNDRRQDTYRKLSNLYLLRNKIVHGSAEDVPDSIYENRHSAVKYAIEALRVIYTRDDLLEVPDSSKRGKKVLLGR
jgi:hypothetical protein